ncbi:MAG: tetratricopeptide repeat protein [Spirochaetales bacterium]|nr:tetratricopeptide repeat protein [Spirochaetales bacterium]
MDITLFLLIAGVVTMLGLLLIVISTSITRQRDKTGGKNRKKGKNRDREGIIREANKRLAQNPKDVNALLELSDVYFQDQDWEKSYRTYGMLIEMCASNPSIDEFLVTLRQALSALNLKKHEEAYKGLMIARTFNSEVFEIAYNLGYIEYRRKNYERAVANLQTAFRLQPNHLPTQKYLGIAFNKTKKHKDAITQLKKVIEQRPDDKESIFFQAQSYYEAGQLDMAIQLFTHLRPDPVYGPQAALMAGSLRIKNKDYEAAILDFEIGLRHENIREEVMLELQYRLSNAHMKMQDLNTALSLLKKIYSINPGYKDVDAQLKKNAELSKNQNLQTFLIAPDADFAALCRRIAENYFPHSHTKISDIQVRKGEYADILAEVETPAWADIVLFRFVRTTGQVGEFVLRDLHARIKDVKAGRGLCMCAGEFSESAVAFVEARFIDLIDKPALMDKLRSI